MATPSPLYKTDKYTGQSVPFTRQSSYINTYILAAGGNVSITTPTDANYCAISSNVNNTIIKFGGSITAAPTANITNGTGPVIVGAYNRTFFDISNITTIGVFSATACTVTVEFFA